MQGSFLMTLLPQKLPLVAAFGCFWMAVVKIQCCCSSGVSAKPNLVHFCRMAQRRELYNNVSIPSLSFLHPPWLTLSFSSLVVENDIKAKLQRNYLGHHVRRAEERRLSVCGEKSRISWLALKTKGKVRILADHIPSIFRRQLSKLACAWSCLSKNWSRVKRGGGQRRALHSAFTSVKSGRGERVHQNISGQSLEK